MIRNNVVLVPSLLYTIGDYLSEDTCYILCRAAGEVNIHVSEDKLSPIVYSRLGTKTISTHTILHFYWSRAWISLVTGT